MQKEKNTYFLYSYTLGRKKVPNKKLLFIYFLTKF